MLSRRERLGTAAFAVGFGKGRILRHPLLQLRVYARHDGDSATRAAFVVSKKLGKATVRNRARRRIREIYRLSAAHGDGRLAGLDLIFLATPAALTAEGVQLQEAIEQLSRRALKIVSS
jgi:ribonuclease P protein component